MMSELSTLSRHVSVSPAGPCPLSGWIPGYDDSTESGMVPFSSTSLEDREYLEYEQEICGRAGDSEGRLFGENQRKSGWITALDAVGLMIMVTALVVWVLRAGSTLPEPASAENSASQPVSIVGATLSK
ncbi:MAG: hypothetical protein V4726_11805 [Verrucomicrobiota bacterium]